MMSVLVTGGLGFIGSHTVVELLASGYRVVVIDNLCNSNIDVIEKIKKISGLSDHDFDKVFEYRNIDIRSNSLSFQMLFTKNEFCCVIHFAALKSVSESINNPIDYYDNNVHGTINLLDMMKRHNVKKIIFSSSATVYGNEQAPFIEDTSKTGIGITNPYGKSKYIIEEILKDLPDDWSIFSLRYFNPIGAHSSGLIGDNPNNIPSNIMPYLLRVSIGKYNVLNIFGNDYNTTDGTAERDYIHVVDLAIAHVKCIGHFMEGYYPMNVGTGKPTSVLELINTFERVNNVRVNTLFADRRNGDVAVSYCDNTMLKKMFNWEPSLTLEDMCRDSYNFIINQV